MNYSFKQTLFKGVKYFIIFALPVLADKFIVAFPELAQLTLGGIMVMVINFLKVRIGLRFVP